ncbi:phosphatase PAP2 family protein [Haloglomus litoreum]|uniref:phosphatase PAP2 family protein n=1 Tax=Haloglomus litoreum TaxID=3034026 RepID=UPI0023E76E53|nr:phosphatase PAP2 family protein [Haloglomus sp. DT116]
MAPGRDSLRRAGVALATRGAGVESLVTGLPLPLLVAFAVVTQLGDVWFYFLTLATAFWVGETVLGDRRQTAFLLGCALTALALSTTLKGYFGLPRPPGATVATGARQLPGALGVFYADAATADGTGFPSGHALGAMLVWGGAALTLDGDRRTRLAAGTAVVGLVGLSRVALGVHYLVDVLAGWAIGGVALVVLLGIGADRSPGRVLSVAALVALAGAVTNFDATHLTALGATLGARITWGAVGGDILRAPTGRRSGLLLTAVGLPLLGGPFAYLYAADPPATVAFAVSGLVTAGVLVLPLVADVVRENV